MNSRRGWSATSHRKLWGVITNPCHKPMFVKEAQLVWNRLNHQIMENCTEALTEIHAKGRFSHCTCLIHIHLTTGMLPYFPLIVWSGWMHCAPRITRHCSYPLPKSNAPGHWTAVYHVDYVFKCMPGKLLDGPDLSDFRLMPLRYTLHMMTSSNGNIFRVTGPLCGEFTVPGKFPAQRLVTRSFYVFFYLRPN